MKKFKLITIISAVFLLLPITANASTKRDPEWCKTHPIDCSVEWCYKDGKDNSGNGVVHGTNDNYRVTWQGRDYQAYCIDKGAAVGAGCNFQCSPLGNDSFGQAYKRLMSTFTGSAEDKLAVRILGIITGYTRPAKATNKKGISLYETVVEEVGGEVTQNHQAYLRALNALYGYDSTSGEVKDEVKSEFDEQGDYASTLKFTVTSISGGVVTINVTSTTAIQKVTFKPSDKDKEQIVSQSWNQKSGVVQIKETDQNCEIGLIAQYIGSNVLFCTRSDTQQFMVDLGSPTDGGAPGTIESYVTDPTEDEGEGTEYPFGVTSDDFKQFDNGYYEQYCKNEEQCPEVPGIDAKLSNCCIDGGFIDVSEPTLDDLFCPETRNGLHVDSFRKRKGTNKYIKTKVEYTTDGEIEDLAQEYCEVYCTQRAYAQIPTGVNKATNGLYFELNKDTAWGTASAFEQGAKRCRVRIDYDAWWKQYDEYIKKEIEAYNNFMQHQAIYRYVDDSADYVHKDPVEVKNEPYFLYCYPQSEKCDDSKKDPVTGKDVSCSNYKNGKGGMKVAIPREELTYNIADLRDKKQEYDYQWIKWDAEKKDVKYTAVEVEKNQAYVKRIVPNDDLTNDSICATEMDEKIKFRNQTQSDWESQVNPYDLVKDPDCKCTPDDPKWKCVPSTQKIEEWSDTKWEEGMMDSWERIKEREKDAAETASSEFFESTRDARNMEKALDACNSYFYQEPTSFRPDKLPISSENGYDTKKNYLLNSTYSFDYTQIYLDPYGNLQEFVTDVPFDGGCTIKAGYEMAHTYEEHPEDAVDPDSGRNDIFDSHYDTNKYKKIKEYFNDFWMGEGKKFKVEDEDSEYYTVRQTNTWYQKFLHQKQGETKTLNFENDHRFTADAVYKMECVWDEVGANLNTFVPSGSAAPLTGEKNITYHGKQYSIFLTTLKGTYDTNHHLGCIGESCVFDDIVATGNSCAGTRLPSSEDVGQSSMSCALEVSYQIVLTGICNPNELTAKIPDCHPYGADMNLYEFKVADPVSIFPNGLPADYADNWKDEKGSAARKQIESDGAKDKTYAPDHLTYSFVLNPETMAIIKGYNADANIDGGYTDFMMNCECNDGACHLCQSEFIDSLVKGTITDETYAYEKVWGNSTLTLQALRSGSSKSVHWKGAE